MPRRTFAIICLLLTIALVAQGGLVTKTDDTVVIGTPTAFDGNILRVALGEVDRVGTTRSIPIQGIVRVYFHQDSEPNALPRTTDGYLAPHENADSAPGQSDKIEFTSNWQLRLAGGDVVTGTFKGWTADQIQIDIMSERAVIAVPCQSIREIWRAPPRVIRRVLDMKVASSTEDVAYIAKDNDIIPIKGTAVAVNDHSLEFIFESQPRKINIDRIIGVVLANQKRPQPSQPAVSDGSVVHVLMHNDDVISGHWIELKDNIILLETLWKQRVELPVRFVSTIDVGVSQSVWLSDLKPVKVEQTPYFDRVISWRVDTALDGGPLKMQNGQQYAHGIAMHSRCVLDYDLDRQFDQFLARLGFEPFGPGSPPGRVAVRVLADGKTLFENPDFRGDDTPKFLTLNVHGAQRLTLEVDFGKDQDINDRIVWGNARLLRGGIDK